jgi:hypothetical protein
MKINNLIPKLYNNNVEMNDIVDSENIEFEELLKFQIRNSFEDTFIAIADSDGLANFEKLFSIVADLETEDLDFRRQRLWNRLNTNPLFTEKYLQQKLDEILGAGNWSYDIVYNDYTLDIYALRPGKIWLNELTSLLKKIMPCNILWTIHIYSITWQSVKDHTDSWQDLLDKELTWQQVMEGEWIE